MNGTLGSHELVRIEQSFEAALPSADGDTVRRIHGRRPFSTAQYRSLREHRDGATTPLNQR